MIMGEFCLQGMQKIPFTCSYLPGKSNFHVTFWMCIGYIFALVAKGAGGTLFLTTDDCQATYDELSARGVVFNDPPTAQPYGVDTSFRDPSGNNVRLTQVMEFSLDRV